MQDNTVLWIVGGLLAVINTIVCFMVHRLMKSIDDLSEEDKALHKKIGDNREDVIQNYVRHEHIAQIKQDIIGRVDRMENSITSSLNTILGSVLKHLTAEKKD